MLPEPSEETVTVFYRGRRDGGFDGSTLLFTLDRGDKHVYAAIRIAEELTLSDGITDDKLEELAVLVGLPRLRALIEDEGVNAFFAGPVQRSLDLTTDTVPKGAVAALDRRKRCHFQERTKRGIICEVAAPTNLAINLLPHNATTQPVCDACGHPDDRFRCSELVHVSTEAGLIGPSGYHRDAGGSCNIGKEVFPDGLQVTPEQAKHQVHRCQVGARDCARMTWRFATVPIASIEDAGSRLVDALDFLDLVVSDRFTFHPLRIRDAATIAALVNDVSTREQFTLAHAALVGLLNGLDWPKADRPGSINALEAFASGRGISLEKPAIATLRAVVAMRQAPPIHNAPAEASRAAAQLGISYPVLEPRHAWRVLRAKTAAAVRSVADSLRWTTAPDDAGLTKPK